MVALTFSACEDVPAPFDLNYNETPAEPAAEPAGEGTAASPYNVAKALDIKIDSIRRKRDLLDGILQSVQTAAASRTSEIARVLTVLSGILLPMTVLTGIYGMNFEHMPELKWTHGYHGVLGLMAVMGVGLFLTFRRLGWVDTGRSRK